MFLSSFTACNGLKKKKKKTVANKSETRGVVHSQKVDGCRAQRETRNKCERDPEGGTKYIVFIIPIYMYIYIYYMKRERREGGHVYIYVRVLVHFLNAPP